jgi:membrane protein
LSYYTLFGLVPLAIVILLVFQYFGIYDNVGVKVKQFAYEQMHLTTIEYAPQADAPEQKVMLTETLDNIIKQFFTGMSLGSLSILSLLLVIWAAIGLLSTIERAFNRMWHVSRGRGFVHRMIDYWALLTLGPLLLGVGIYATTEYATLRTIEATVLTHVTPLFVSSVLALFAFFLLYLLLPNTRVQPGPALWGAAVAAIAWTAAKWGFSKYVTDFIPYAKIYGVLGLIPLTVFWIYITWLIILFGLQLTFTTQNLSSLDAAEIAAARKAEQDYFLANDLTAISLTKEIAEAFYRSEGPVTAEAVCRKLDLPQELGDQLIGCLISAGLVARTQEPAVGLVPARAPEQIRLSDVVDAVAGAAFAQPRRDEQGPLAELLGAQRQSLASHTLRDICRLDERSMDGGDQAEGLVADEPQAKAEQSDRA